MTQPPAPAAHSRSRLSRGTRQDRVTSHDYSLLGVLALIAGSSFLFQKIAVADTPPILITQYRLAISALILAVILGWQMWGNRNFLHAKPAEHLGLLVSAFTGLVIPFLLTSWAVKRIDSGLAAILLGAMPLVTIVVAHFATRDEKLNPAKIGAIALGLAGLAVLFWPSLTGGASQDPLSKLAVLAAAVFYAFNALLQKRLIGLEAPVVMGLPIIYAAIAMIPLSLYFHSGEFAMPSVPSAVAILLLSLLPTVAAVFIMYEIISRQGAGFFGQINLLSPPVAVAYGYVILGEVPQGHAFAGLVIILAGVLVARNWNGRGVLPVN